MQTNLITAINPGIIIQWTFARLPNFSATLKHGLTRDMQQFNTFNTDLFDLSFANKNTRQKVNNNYMRYCFRSADGSNCVEVHCVSRL